jgi:hypothetical protein
MKSAAPLEPIPTHPFAEAMYVTIVERDLVVYQILNNSLFN